MKFCEKKAHISTVLLLGTVCGFVIAGCRPLPSRSAYFEDFRNEQLQSANTELEEQTSVSDVVDSPSDSGAEETEKDGPSPTVSGKLSIEEAVRYALALNPSLKAVLKKRLEAEGRKLEAFAEAMPKVNIEADYTRLGQLQTISLPTRQVQVGEQDNYSFTTRITQPVYKGGNMWIAQRAARLFSYLQDEKVRDNIQDVIYQVAKAYYDTMLAERLIAVRKSGLDSARAHLATVRSKKKQGAATKYDVLRARVEVSNFRAKLIEQKNRRETAVARLFQTMGVSQESDVTLSGEFEYEVQRPSYKDIVESALTNRPDIFKAKLGEDLQKEAVRRAYSRFLPRLNLFLQDKRSRPDPMTSTQDWGDEWMGGVQLKWAMFDGLGREGKIDQERAKLEQQQKKRDVVRQKVLLDIRNALNELDNAIELVDSQKLNVKRAKEAREQVQAGYKQGVNTEVEVLDASVALTEAKSLYHEALYKYTMARLDIANAKGILGPEPGSTDKPDDVSVPEVLETGVSQ